MERTGYGSTQEQLKSFDFMASVDMMRFDIQRFNRVLPETRQRVADEELSLMAEGSGRAARPVFHLQRQDDELVYHNHGEWQPYMDMLQTGLEVAYLEARQDGRKQFLVPWAERDFAVGYRLKHLQSGERLAWYNPYPEDIEARHGATFLKNECGLFPERKMGFIHLAVGEEDGTVRLETQTVDNSDPDAFMAVERLIQENPTVTMDELLEAYDTVLEDKYGVDFYAGREGADRSEDAWKALLSQEDLVTYFLDELEGLAAAHLPRPELKRQVKRHLIGTWKALKLRLDGRQILPTLATNETPSHSVGYMALERERMALEVNASFKIALANGEVKAGCGGSISADSEDDLDVVTLPETFDGIFGKKLEDVEEEDEHGPLEFKCQKGHRNKRKRGQLIDNCKVCRINVRCKEDVAA